MIAFHCSVDFDDILDTSEGGEWDQYLTDGKIILSPTFGKFEVGDGNTEVFEDGCGRKIPDATTLPWTFTTISAKKDYSDEDFWYKFHKQFSQYTWGYFNCEGRMYISDEAVQEIKAGLEADPIASVAVNSPGHRFSLDSIPQFKEGSGAGKAGVWTASGEFITMAVLRGVTIPGLNTLLSEKG
jgi:hypothetical protein